MLNKYYFVSNTKLKDEVLKPRIPQNRLTKSGREDNTIQHLEFVYLSLSLDVCNQLILT